MLWQGVGQHVHLGCRFFLGVPQRRWTGQDAAILYASARNTTGYGFNVFKYAEERRSLVMTLS